MILNGDEKMKSTHKILFPLLLCGLLCGCTATPQQSAQESESKAESQPKSETPLPEVEILPAVGPEMPTLAINTVSRDPDIMDFVTKPVARHVAEAIASWTPGYVIPPEPYYETCQVYLTEMKDSGLPVPAEAEVKVRGNWTTTYDKKPLRIKFTEKQNLGGLHDGEAFRNWLLLAGYKDGSLLRDKAALQMARGILGPDGLYAADAKLTEVTVNGEYWGVYLLTEPNSVNDARIALTEPEEGYTGTDIGYLLEFDGYFFNEDDLHQFHVDYADNAPLKPYDGNDGSGRTITCLPKGMFDEKQDVGMSIKSDIYSKEQHDFIADYVNNVYRILYSAAYEDKAYQFNADYTKITETDDLTPQQAVEQAINVDSLADAYLIAELTCDADIYWSSFYMDADFGADGDKKLTFEAPWDFDSSMGNKDRCADGTGFYAGNIVPDVDGVRYETCNPWLTVLMYEDWFQDVIREKWTKAYDSGLFKDTIDQIRTDTETCQEAFKRNYKKWNNLIDNEIFANELAPKSKLCKTHEAAAEYLADWLEKRVAFLNDAWHS